MGKKEKKLKLDKDYTKKIILEALDEHHKNINPEVDPTIGNVIDRCKISDMLKNTLKYMGLYILLVIVTCAFGVSTTIDYTQVFTDPSIIKILFALGVAFIYIVVCSIILIPTIKLYDKLVLKYKKFTRVFAIAVIINTMNIIKPTDSFIIDFLTKLLG